MDPFSLRSASRFLACSLFFTAISPVFASEPQWVEIRSPHFSVVTDAGEKRGREVAVRFEQMRAVFATLMTKANVNLPIPLEIVAFRNSKELRQVVPLWHGKPIQAAGLFQPGQDRCFIMVDMSVENPWTVVFHEYAHQLMNGVLSAEIDPWFEEGFAEYFSSIEVDGKQARVGKVPQYEYDVLQQQGFMKVADLFKVQHNSATYNENGDHRTVFYAESGILVHYLYDNGLIPKLATYFTLKTDKGMPVEEAIQMTFGMSSAQFDKALRAYVLSGRYRYYAIATPPDIVEKGYSTRTLPSVESGAVIADVHLHSADYHEKAISEFQEILKADPNNAAACRGLGYAYLQKRDFQQASEFFKRASQADSKDPRVHYYSALLMNENFAGSSDTSDTSAMIRELETSIDLDPSFADAYMLLGYAYGRQGDRSKALATMQKAVVLNPRNENYQFNLAQAYLSSRQADQGIAILQMLSKSSDPMIAARASESLTRAQQFKASLEAAKLRPGIAQAQPPDEVNDTSLIESAAPQETAVTQGSVSPGLQAPIQFLKGTLLNVDCNSPPGASLAVMAGHKAWTMNVKDRSHVLVIGANEFSCSWRQKTVAINYRQTAEATGSIVSIEVQ